MPTFTCENCRRANRVPTTPSTTCYFCGSVHGYDPKGYLVMTERRDQPLIKNVALGKPAAPQKKPSAFAGFSPLTPVSPVSRTATTAVPKLSPKERARRVRSIVVGTILLGIALAVIFFYFPEVQYGLYRGYRDVRAVLRYLFWAKASQMNAIECMVVSLLMYGGWLPMFYLLTCGFWYRFIEKQGGSVKLRFSWRAALLGFVPAWIGASISMALTDSFGIYFFWIALLGNYFIGYSAIPSKNTFIKGTQLLFTVSGMITGLILAADPAFIFRENTIYLYVLMLLGAVAGDILGVRAAFGLMRAFALFTQAEQEWQSEQRRQRQLVEDKKREERRKQQEIDRLKAEEQQKKAAQQQRLAESRAFWKQQDEAQKLLDREREKQAAARRAAEQKEKLRALRILVFDTETASGAADLDVPVHQTHRWPRLVQLAWREYDGLGRELAQETRLVKPEGFEISAEAFYIHQISTAEAREKGLALATVMAQFNAKISRADILVCHNAKFDIGVIEAELIRLQLPYRLQEKKKICTMHAAVNFCALPRSGGGYKYPKLQELHQKLFNSPFAGAHDAQADTAATAKCFWEMHQRKLVTLV